MHINNTRQYVFLSLLVVSIFSGISSLYYYKTQQRIEYKKLLSEQLHIKKENKEKKRAEITSLFDGYLNSFTTELRTKAELYKENRKVLKEIISPYNFETPEYSKENYFLFKNILAPSLRAKSSAIIGVFQKYTDKINYDLQNKDNKIEQFFLNKWQEMSHNQLTKYVNFFAKEDELIQAYDEIITFYYVHSNLFSVDVESNKFIFKRKKDREKEKILRDTIKELSN